MNGPGWIGTLLVLLVSTTPAFCDVIYETDDPFGGPFGLIGFDVCADQSVALRFTPDGAYTLDRVSLWFMNNDFSGATHPLVEVTLRADSGGAVPGGEIIEAWTFNVSAIGWDPMLEVMDSAEHPPLEGGVNYWIVTESTAPCGNDGVWNWAAMGTGFVATSTGYGERWQPGGQGAVPATIVEGSPAVPGDVDGDGDVDLFDFAGYLDCVTNPTPLPADSGCTAVDYDSDGDVDWTDFARFQLSLGASP